MKLTSQVTEKGLRRARIYAVAAFALFIFAVVSAGSVYASGTISGNVFQDFDGDGNFDTTVANGVAVDLQLAGVTVTAYDSAGANQGSTTTVVCTAAGNPISSCTGANAGQNYSLSAGGTGPYRIEFTWNNSSGVLENFEHSANSTDSVDGGTATNSGSTVQFVPDGSTSNVNLALARPCDHCQSSPTLVTDRYESGTGATGTTNATNASVVSMAYNPSSHTNAAQLQQLGSVWGLAYNGLTKRVFASAFLKRHVGLGPRSSSGVVDGVYVIDFTGAPSVEGGFRLEGVSPTNGGTISLGSVDRTTDANYTLSATPSAETIDLDAFAKVGKVGFGDSDFAYDGKTMWLVNLNQRTLIQVDTSQVAFAASANSYTAPNAAVNHYEIVSSDASIPDITGAPSCTNGSLRPFGLKIREKYGYLGVVCDAASSASVDNPPELIGYVLQFDVPNPTSFTTLVTIPMNYNREPYYQMDSAHSSLNRVDGGWQRWMNTWTDAEINTPATSGCCDSFRSAPSPLVSDIDFMPDGSLVVGVMDRFSHQSGWGNRKAIAGDATSLAYGSVGDILLAKWNGASFVLESGETDPGNPDGGTANVGYRTDDSPGNAGEFFYGDSFKGFDASHFETALGGLGLAPGTNQVTTTSLDPNQFNSQGLIWLSTTVGNKVDSYAVSTGTGTATFGKANGMGDLEFLCEAAPIEIGNRVWNDADGDGIQDPNELPLSGVTVELRDSSNVLVASAVTSANGEYYFSSASGSDTSSSKFGLTINYGANYTVRIDPTAGSNPAQLSGLSLTTQNAAQPANGNVSATDNNPITDVADSDAANSAGMYVIAFTTGNAGSNNNGLDFGFSLVDWGDLPDTGTGTSAGNYQTLATDGGPSHIIVAGLNIGAPDVVDAETGLLQNATATADDNSNTGFADDEDGISSFPTFKQGQPAAINVLVNNPAGGIGAATLYGFIDWNGDGDFGDADEVQSVSVPDSTIGTVTLNFNVPAGAVTGANLGARFRLTTDTLTLDNAGAIGAASNGEVEDYIIRVSGAGAIGNYVWVDENSDGYRDKGEVGIPNVTVQLKDKSGNVIATQVTDSNGGYLFTDLGAGTYYVEVLNSTIPTGMTQTTTYPNNGADFYNQNQSVGDGYQIVLGAGQTNLTADFGYNWNPTNDVTTGGAVNAVAALGDRIWIDTNGNGAQDANEIGVQGVVVTIYGSPGPDNIWGNGDDVPYTNGGYIPTRTTDENGFYMFDGLPPGQYSVRVTNSGSASHNVLDTTQYTQTGDADHWGTTGTVNDNQTTIPVVLGPGDVFLNADFGYQPGGSGGTPALGSIGNFVWYDRDADGVGPNGNGATPGNDNTEFGLGGVTVALIKDLNANGHWDAGEPIIATTHTSNGTEDVDGDGTTDPVGFYRFRSLPITDGTGTDDYLVWVNDTNHVLDGLVATYDKDGSSPVSGLATGLGISAVTNLGTTGGSPYGTNDATDQDFGYTDSNVPGATNPGMIGDRVWLDLNSDGVQDANEPGIPGVRVVLYDSDGTTQLAETVTGANGLYLFPNLIVDDGGGSHQYYVEVDWTTLPGGMTQTYDDDDGTGPFSTPDRSTATLSAGSPVNLNQDFGYVGSGSIGNFVWLDTNANGIVDGSDASQGIAGVTVDLYDDVNRNGIVDAGDIKLSTTTTDANGGYLFTGLPTEDIDEGDAYYVVNVTDTAGVLTGFWHSLGDPSVASDNTSKASPYSVILATGTTATENVLTVDFGYYVVPGAVGNYVWLDTDKNGIQNAGENGINGVTVTLEITYPNGTVTTITTVTQTEPGGTRDGWYSFGNLLQDENYNGIGTYGAEPTFNITVTLPPGYTASPTGNGTPTTDSNDPTGTGAQPFKGQINTLFANDSASISSYDFGMYLSPTAVDVKKVRVKVTADNTVLLRWRSVSETRIAGFNIQRSDAADGTFANVNAEFISAKAPGNVKGKAYKFVDATAVVGATYWYRIEIVHTDAGITTTQAKSVTIGDSACNTALTAPVAIAPLDGAKVRGTQVRLKWQAVTCAAYYRVQVKPDTADAKLLVNRKHLKPALNLKNLEKGRVYLWRVQACDANNVCVANEWSRFEVKK